MCIYGVSKATGYSFSLQGLLVFFPPTCKGHRSCNMYLECDTSCVPFHQNQFEVYLSFLIFSLGWHEYNLYILFAYVLVQKRFASMSGMVIFNKFQSVISLNPPQHTTQIGPKELRVALKILDNFVSLILWLMGGFHEW
ncbi:hypothetical protein ACJX0J_038731 [Zea mays]